MPWTQLTTGRGLFANVSERGQILVHESYLDEAGRAGDDVVALQEREGFAERHRVHLGDSFRGDEHVGFLRERSTEAVHDGKLIAAVVLRFLGLVGETDLHATLRVGYGRNRGLNGRESRLLFDDACEHRLLCYLSHVSTSKLVDDFFAGATPSRPGVTAAGADVCGSCVCCA